MVSFSVDFFLLLFLLAISFYQGGSHLEKTALVVIFLPVFCVFFESLSRKVLTGDQGIMIRKFLRNKELHWEEITHAGALILRKRVYLLLTTVKGFYILSNAYDRFSALASDVADHMDKEKVEEEVRKQIDHPLRNISDIVMTWFTALILIGIIAVKFFTS
ncbi:MAG TPA: hypothetical protein VMT12_04845 [Syntrophales bacterium]|nr:hypothetical protein [Syntrophales bacterium]